MKGGQGLTVVELHAIVGNLEANLPISDDVALTNNGRDQKEHWLGWLSEYKGPGYYGRSDWDRDAQFIYNHINDVPMLLWLAEAVGVPTNLVLVARNSRTTGEFRRVIPWRTVEARMKTASPKNIRPVRAISIRQPYVEAILRGVKKKEFRTVATRIRETVYLYASLKPADDPAAWRKIGAGPDDLPAGVIVGTVDIVDCKYDDRNDEYQYILKNPRRLKRILRPINQPQPVFWRPAFR